MRLKVNQRVKLGPHLKHRRGTVLMKKGKHLMVKLDNGAFVTGTTRQFAPVRKAAVG